MQLWMVCSLVVLAVYFILICVMKAMSKNRLLLEQRLAAYSLQEKVESVIREELSRPLTERLLRPLLQKVSALPARMLPGAALEGLSRKLVMAGNPGHLSPQEFAVLKLSLAVLLPGALYIFGLLFMPTSVRGMVLVGMAVLGYFSPEIFLKLKRRARQEEIRNMLPEVLDLLMVSVEAGLGFDAAMAKVVEKMDGVLPQELGRLLQEIKMGKPRKEAMKDTRERVDVEDFSSFISAIIQADQLGVSMGSVMRLQARDSREKRRQAAQERAMKAPVKMVIPLVLFIFPAIFIVLLGPAMLDIFDALTKM